MLKGVGLRVPLCTVFCGFRRASMLGFRGLERVNTSSNACGKLRVLCRGSVSPKNLKAGMVPV